MSRKNDTYFYIQLYSYEFNIISRTSLIIVRFFQYRDQFESVKMDPTRAGISASATEGLNPDSLQSIIEDPEGNPFEIILPDDKM